MAYTQIASFNWGTGPAVPMTMSYDRQRSGADMQYKIKVVISALTGTHYFGYPIYLGIKLDNTAKVSGYTLKSASPSQWSSAITYESAWLTVSGKTSGSTALAVNIYSGSGNSRNYTYNYSLTVDPAASTMTVAGGTLGTAQTITLTKHNAGFVSTLVARCGSQTQTITTKTAATSVSWTPPLTFATADPSGPAVPVTITCTTYTGADGDTVGSTTASSTQQIPASVKPTVSMTLTDPTGNKTTYGDYVRTRSTLQVSLTAAGAQGSTITGYRITVDKGTTNVWTYSSNGVTTPEIPVDGTLTVTTTVTDSRGRTGTATSTITVLPYNTPRVPNLAVARCDAQGAAAAEGDHCKTTFSAIISAVGNRNTAAYKVGYREKGTTAWTEITVTAAAGNYAPTDASVIFEADPDIAYEVRVAATDAFTTIYGGNASLGIAFVLVQATDDVTGLGIGQRATESNAININLPVKFHGSVQVDTPPASTNTAVTIAAGGTAWNDSDCWAKKDLANLVELHLRINCTASGSEQLVATLPAGLRPSSNVFCVCYNTSRQLGYAYINNSGQVKAWMPATGQTLILATFHAD